MIADDKLHAVIEFCAQFIQAFLCALTRCRIAHTHKAGVAGVIPVGHNQIHRPDVGQKTFQLRSLIKRMTHPDTVSEGPGAEAEQGIGDGAQFVITTAGAFGGTRIVKVAQNANGDLA